MINSFEEGEEELDFCFDEIISTSLKEKSIIFADIENQLVVEHQFENRFLFVLNELKTNAIERKYIKKIYNMVLTQLIKDKKIYKNSQLWVNFINSF